MGLVIGQKFLKANDEWNPKKISLLNTNVAGFQYYDGYDVLGQLEIDKELILNREPVNKFDRNAVAVKFNNSKLGYLPQVDNLVVANMMDQGMELKAVITDIDPDSHPFWALEVEVYFETK